MPLKTNFDEQSSINLTPMIDIVFLLIIFFMVGTKFVEMERKIAVQVPEVTETAALSAAPQKRVINVYSDGEVTLDRQPVTPDQLLSTLTAARHQYADIGVIVRGDAKGEFQNVAKVLNTVRRAGISEMGISVRQAQLK